MASSLTGADVQRYREDGYLAPIDALTEDEARAARAQLEAAEAQHGGALPKHENMKPHLLYTWASELVRHPKVLDAVEGVIGPDILCWSSNLFLKNPNDGKRVTWHQDVTYWGVEPTDITTAWIALSRSDRASGCMRVVPGSHHEDVAEHVDTFAADNLLSRGQEIAVDVSEADAADIVLRPGQMSLHHTKIVHGSEPNGSHDRRIGFVVRYLAPSVRQTSGFEDSATLVRGRDPHGNFELEPTPASDLSAEAVAYHRVVVERTNRILMRGAAR